MAKLIATLFGWLTGNTLDRILDTVDKRADNDTERERIRSQVLAEYLKSQVAIATGRGWWFPLFFIVPLGLWFASVCFYSMLFCRACAWPQEWSVAALPAPLDEWGGAIVASLFIGKIGEKIVATWRR